MIEILRRLPINGPGAGNRLMRFGNASIKVKPFQMVAWASITLRTESLAGIHRGDLPRFPVLIDTGHGDSFTIQDTHLRVWANRQPSDFLSMPRRVTINSRFLCQTRAAALWIYPNLPGSEDIDPLRKPFRLALDGGMSVLPERIEYPRMPLLGLRTLLSNGLTMIVDGPNRAISLFSDR